MPLLRFRTWAVLALALTLVACADRTSLLVTVTSPLAVPDDIDRIHITVVGSVEATMIDQDYPLTSPWPHSVSIRPGQVEDQDVTITVTGFHGDTFVVRRVVRSSFVRGEQVEVEVELFASCRDVTCRDGYDCVGGVCVGQMADGGVGDGGVDGGVDAGCMSNADCNDMINCTDDTCDNGSCLHEPNDSRCGLGAMCDLTRDPPGCPAIVCTIDEECNDFIACNGTEFCDGMRCTSATPVDCGDADACTTDRCDEANRGACVYTTIDLDSDTFGDAACTEVGGVPATDCNDANANVYPGAPEECNGIDDDCNGTCDDAFTCCRSEVGPCLSDCGTMGTRVCGGSCAWGVCSPPAETCNAVDDDCNGEADDIFACVQGASEACTTSCGSMGMRTCGTDCTWGACTPPAESCNGVDDDCDSMPDEGFACVAGRPESCTTTCGTTGSRTCTSSCTMPATCTPPAEGCNGIDDDCDGMTDESSECTPGTMQACTTSCGTPGMRTCSSMCTYGTCTAAETCNGVDDDCDGIVDDGFTCVRGSTGTCPSTCGTTGTRTCGTSCTWGTCTPPVEACDGRDQDCDTLCDETFACCAGTSGTCTTTCGTMGTRTCSASCGWSVCSPPSETCNGLDDDCNGGCDDGLECCANSTGSCTTTCGTTGTRSCSSSCSWNACNPPVEACNAVDDDCDMRIDEDFQCVPGAVQNCTTTCGSTGLWTCTAMCMFPATCTPPAEACNGTDDDCDGMVDEGCGGCTGCTGAATVTLPGGRYNVTLGADAGAGSCSATSGTEGYLTLTLTSPSDVFISTHQGASFDTVVYLRECCTGPERTGACNDNADGRNTSRLSLTNVPAGTYTIVVDTKADIAGTVPVDVYVTAPGMASDRCGNPTFIPAGTTNLMGSTCSYSADTQSAIVTGCQYAATGLAVERVFYFYVPTARTVTFNGCQAGSNYDQTVYIRSVCTDGALTNQVACNDDGCGGPLMCDRAARSSVTATLQPGLYYVFVDGYQGTACPCGNYQFAITGI